MARTSDLVTGVLLGLPIISLYTTGLILHDSEAVFPRADLAWRSVDICIVFLGYLGWVIAMGSLVCSWLWRRDRISFRGVYAPAQYICFIIPVANFVWMIAFTSTMLGYWMKACRDALGEFDIVNWGKYDTVVIPLDMSIAYGTARRDLFPRQWENVICYFTFGKVIIPSVIIMFFQCLLFGKLKTVRTLELAREAQKPKGYATTQILVVQDPQDLELGRV